MILRDRVRRAADNKISPLVSRQDYAYDMIKKMIMEGVIEKEERIVERQISEALGLSRVPVREALLRLSAEGVLVSIPKGGFVVRSYTKDEVINLYQLRDAVESYAARLAAMNGKKEDIALCEAMHENIRKVGETQFEYFEYDELFHRSILKASGNNRMTELFDILHYQHICLTGNDLGFKPQNNMASEVVRDHGKVLEAIKNREPEAAAAAMSHHINCALNGVLKIIEGL